MSAILPPAERLWWKHPLDRVEGTWIAIAFAWCMVMFFMMIYWHAYGKQNLSTETYKTTPEKFSAKAQAVVDKYTVRTETTGVSIFGYSRTVRRVKLMAPTSTIIRLITVAKTGRLMQTSGSCTP